MFHPKTLVALGVYTIAGAFGLILFIYATPRIEAVMAPVLADQKVEFDDDDRTPGKMCWTWSWNKVRYAQAVTLAWSMTVEGTAAEFPTIAERQRDGETLRYPQTAGLGPGRNDLCVNIPADLDKVKGLVIRGQINYRMPHGLWTIWQDLPAVRVPPLP
jgi:hypothetical protein